MTKTKTYECYFCNAVIPEDSAVCPECHEKFEVKKPERRPANTSLGIIIMLLVLIAALLLAPMLGLKTKPAYEYQIIGIEDASFDRDMKALGNQGWELIFARRATDSGDAIYEAIFKREK